MTEYNLTLNYSSIADGAKDITIHMPAYIPLLLFFVFGLIVGLGSMSSKKNSGFANYALWFTIAGMVVSTISFMLYLVEDLILLEVVVTCIAFTVMFLIWYFLASDE